MRDLLVSAGLCGVLAAASCSSDHNTGDASANGGQGGKSPNGGAGGTSAGTPANGGTASSQAGTAGTGGVTAGAGGTGGVSVGAAGELGTAGEAGGGSVSSDVGGTLLYGNGSPVSAAAIEIGGTIAVTDTLDLAQPTPPEPSLPVNDATGVTSTTPFRWAAGSNALTYTQSLTPTWTIYRIGLSSGTTFPDLSRFGIAFPKAVAVTWQVISVGMSGGTGTPEDFFTSQVFPLPAGSFIAYGNSETWSFTTAP